MEKQEWMKKIDHSGSKSRHNRIMKIRKRDREQGRMIKKQLDLMIQETQALMDLIMPK